MIQHYQGSTTAYLDHKVCVSRKGFLSLRQGLVIILDLENADAVVSDLFALLLLLVLVSEDMVAGVEGFVLVVVVVVAVEFLPPPQPNILRSSEPLL